MKKLSILFVMATAGLVILVSCDGPLEPDYKQILIDVDFENQLLPGNWVRYDYGDPHGTWHICDGAADGTIFCMGDSSGFESDDYIVTQQLDLTNAVSAEITYWYKAGEQGLGDTFQFMVSEGSGDPADNKFVPRVDYPHSKIPTTWTQATYDMSMYSGAVIYLAWYHKAPVSGAWFAVDEIVFTATFKGPIP